MTLRQSRCQFMIAVSDCAGSPMPRYQINSLTITSFPLARPLLHFSIHFGTASAVSAADCVGGTVPSFDFSRANDDSALILLSTISELDRDQWSQPCP